MGKASLIIPTLILCTSIFFVGFDKTNKLEDKISSFFCDTTIKNSPNSVRRINAGVTFLYIYSSVENKRLYEIRERIISDLMSVEDCAAKTVRDVENGNDCDILKRVEYMELRLKAIRAYELTIKCLVGELN